MTRTRLIAVIGVALLAAFILGWVSGRPSESEHVNQVGETEQSTIWTCAMHPQIKLPEPGQCPICGMDLIPLDSDSKSLGPSELKMSDYAQSLAAIEVATVERRYVAREIPMVGKVEYDEKRLGVISAWVSGRIDRLFVDFTGVNVNKGDHMVDLYSPELVSSQQELLEALHSSQRGSESTRASAKRRLASVREKLRLLGLSSDQIKAIEQQNKATDLLTVYAPMAGVVIKKHAIEGDYLKTGAPIYTIADLSRVWVKLDAYESDMAWLRYGQDVEFEVESYPGEAFHGRIVFIDPVLNTKTRTIKIRLNVDNAAGRLKPDMFVRARVFSKLSTAGKVMDPQLVGKWICPMHPEIIKDQHGQCDICAMDLVTSRSLGYVSAEDPASQAPLVIPQSAPLITGKRAIVYVADANRPGVFAGRQITLGPRTSEHFVVLDGLEEGERVVTNGNFKIDSELQIKGKNSMMYRPEEVEDQKAKAFVAPPQMRIALNSLWDAYLDILDALSSDQAKPAAQQANLFLKRLNDVPVKELDAEALLVWNRYLDRVRTQSLRLAVSTDLPSARDAFAPLANDIILLQRHFDLAGGAPAQLVHCPMALNNRGADWLQPGTEIENPFLGQAMLRCGEVRQTFNVRVQAKATEKPKTKKVLPEALNESLRLVVNACFDASAALSDDDLDGARLPADRALEALKLIDMKSLNQDQHQQIMPIRQTLTRLFKSVSDESEIEAARLTFVSLSNEIYALLKGYQLNMEAFRFYCPMFGEDGAHWLQSNSDKRNPYFGSMMLTCGNKTERIGAEPEGTHVHE